MKKLLSLLLISLVCTLGCSSPDVHSRHIFISKPTNYNKALKAEKRQQAEHIRAELILGAEFETIATKYSDCPSKTVGGDLGIAPSDEMVKPLKDAMLNQEIGEIGPVVETSFGFHILQVLERGQLRNETSNKANEPTSTNASDPVDAQSEAALF